MTLQERYAEAKKARPAKAQKVITPAAAFVEMVANVTKKSEIAVRRWLGGQAEPDALTKAVLAEHFNTTPEELFPLR